MSLLAHVGAMNWRAPRVTVPRHSDGAPLADWSSIPELGHLGVSCRCSATRRSLTAARNNEREALTSEQRAHLALERIEQLWDSIRVLIRATKWIVLGWFGVLIARALAGQETTAEFVLSIFSNLGASRWPYLLLAGGLAMWALLERRERRRKTAYLTNRIRLLEQKIDPNRSSSELLSTGETRQEDVP